tara:strand:+ start:2942 stop:3220 length:279 start_codon:yes stop_codon:yes gene_type:complete
VNCAKKYNLTPCQVSNGERRRMILVDTHAIRLYSGLKAALPKFVGFYTRNMYSPLQGIALIVHKSLTYPCRKNNYLGQNFNVLKKVINSKLY